MADDFAMGAIAKTGKSPETAVVEALAAGIDMVMVWPPDLRRVHRAILRALKNGQLARSRLEDAVQRILRQKARYGLLREDMVTSSEGVPRKEH
jgi:beta-N-acetylhexosaminidase